MQTKIQNWLVSVLAVAVLVLAGCTDQSSTSSAASGSPTAAGSPTASPAASSPPAASPSPTALPSNSQAKTAPRLVGKATVVITVKGAPITLELDGVNAPLTSGNFVDLVDRKVYDGLVFHRVVREPDPFVVQGGDPQGKDPNFPAERLGTGGFIDPVTGQERMVPLEITPDTKDAQPVYGKTLEMAGITSAPKLKHTRGALAMARSEFPDSASAQFYITLADLKFLDGKYAVFGYVKQGMEVVDKIKQGDRIDSIKVTQGLENLKK